MPQFVCFAAFCRNAICSRALSAYAYGVRKCELQSTVLPPEKMDTLCTTEPWYCADTIVSAVVVVSESDLCVQIIFERNHVQLLQLSRQHDITFVNEGNVLGCMCVGVDTCMCIWWQGVREAHTLLIRKAPCCLKRHPERGLSGLAGSQQRLCQQGCLTV